MGYTEEDLAGLSATEREALTAPDEDDLEGADDVDDGTEDDNSDDDQVDDDSPAVNATDSTAVASESAATVVSGDADTDADRVDDFAIDDVPAVTFIPKLSGDVLPEYQTEIDRITTAGQAEIDKLDDQYASGDLGEAERRTQVRAIERTLKLETRKLEASSQNQEISEQLWRAEQAAFFKANPGLVQTKNPEGYAKLNSEVLRVVNDPANASLSGIQVLCLAKRNIDEAAEFAEFKAMKKAQKAAVKGKAEPAQVAPKPAAKRPSHQTLRDVPAADAADVGQDKYAHLDKLSGLALEAAVSKLSPADKAAYLAGA